MSERERERERERDGTAAITFHSFIDSQPDGLAPIAAAACN